MIVACCHAALTMLLLNALLYAGIQTLLTNTVLGVEAASAPYWEVVSLLSIAFSLPLLLPAVLSGLDFSLGLAAVLLANSLICGYVIDAVAIRIMQMRHKETTKGIGE